MASCQGYRHSYTGGLERKKMLVTQSCLTLCDPMDCSLPDSSVHGILQARILEWLAIPFFRRSSLSRDWSQADSLPWAIRKSHVGWKEILFTNFLKVTCVLCVKRNFTQRQTLWPCNSTSEFILRNKSRVWHQQANTKESFKGFVSKEENYSKVIFEVHEGMMNSFKFIFTWWK